LPLRDQGIVRIIYASQRDNPRATGPSAFTVTEEFAAKYPATTGLVVRAFVRAAQWVARPENRDEALQICARSGVPAASLDEDYSGIALHDQFDPRLDEFFRAQYADGIDFAKQQKLIRNDVDLATWIDPQYQDAAFATLGLTNFWPNRHRDGATATN